MSEEGGRVFFSNVRRAASYVAEKNPPAFLAHERAGLLLCRSDVPAWVHPVRHAARRERFPVFLADVRIFHPVRDGGASLGDVHAGVIDGFLSRRAWISPVVVRAEPGGQAERVRGDAEMLMVPARAAGG